MRIDSNHSRCMNRAILLIIIFLLCSPLGYPDRSGEGFLHVGIGSDGRANIVTPEGHTIPLPGEHNQVGIEASRTAEDGETLGWLVEYNNPGVSYPVAGMLVIWRGGRVVRKFRADAVMWSWAFYERGKQVAYHDGPLHGEAISHCELRDIESGRLLHQWNGDIRDIATLPTWASKLSH